MTNDLDFKNDIQNKIITKVNNLLYLELEKYAIIDIEENFKEFVTDVKYKEIISTFSLYEAYNIFYDKIIELIENKLDNFNAKVYSSALINSIRNTKTINISSILQELYGGSSIDNKEIIFLNRIKDKIDSEYGDKNRKNIYAEFRFNLNAIKIFGLSLKGQLIDMNSKNVFIIKLVISNSFFSQSFNCLAKESIPLILNFFNYYQFKVWLKKEITFSFWVELSLFQSKNNVITELIRNFLEKSSFSQKKPNLIKKYEMSFSGLMGYNNQKKFFNVSRIINSEHKDLFFIADFDRSEVGVRKG